MCIVERWWIVLAETEEYDVIIIGAGPAGLSTAIMCATRRLKILLLEKDRIGGLLTTLYPNKIIPNYLGFPEGIVAIELVRCWLGDLRKSGVTIKEETVLDVTRDLTVTTNNKTYRTRAIVAATGTRPRHLEILNEDKYSKNNKGLYYFPSHPEDFLRKKVLVVGGGDTALDATLELLNLADDITLIHRKEAFRAFEENVEKVMKSSTVNILFKAELVAIKGRDRVDTAVIMQDDKKIEKQVDAIIVAVGLVPNNEIFKNLNFKSDNAGFICTDGVQRTSVEGIFAVGDIVKGGLRLITVAAAHGSIASHQIYSYVKHPYWAREEWPPNIP
ncbi:MAG: NAD(P)/FAD-dependent oxidoreductase [Candidatus Bathyarchaeota archaeon]